MALEVMDGETDEEKELDEARGNPLAAPLIEFFIFLQIHLVLVLFYSYFTYNLCIFYVV